ncbi:MAG: 30S ribosomal protein S3 [bacterium]|nr:30S ribosomal protein S3 [bacterium]
MAQKINPKTFRLGITVPWSSRWFFKKPNRFFLEEDHAIRTFLMGKVRDAGIDGIDIERTGPSVRVTIKAHRPGLIIGRGGKGIEELRDGLLVALRKLRVRRKVTTPSTLHLNIEELKRAEASAPVVAQQVATDLERRMPFRRLMKRTLENVMQNREVKGAKVRLSGRLNGAEISRSEWKAMGTMPLQTLRANIDYGEATAFNTYGTIGVKVWIYKGEIFEKSEARSTKL